MPDISTNFIVIDDEPDTIRGFLPAIEGARWWSQNEIDMGDSVISLKPNCELIEPDNPSLGDYLSKIRSKVFGRGEVSAAEASGYIPAIVFLVDWKFDSFAWSPKDGAKPSGIEVCEEIKKYIPQAFCCIVTAHHSDEIGEIGDEHIDYSIEKNELKNYEAINFLARKISTHFASLIESPTWAGLRAYSKDDKQICHAMALADHQNSSASIAGFSTTLGNKLFSFEASLTLPPLDSLLSPAPEGCIQYSQNLFAKSFGARRARFTTNGTTGSNSILWTYLFNEGDLVLVDRNCHISHHYSAAKQGATPIYLEPEVEFEPDVFGPPSLNEVIGKLTTLQENGLLSRVAGVVLTNATFDGNILSSIDYIEGIDAFLRSAQEEQLADRFIYFFDEAWFSFARFDPGLIRYTAMFGAKHANIGKSLSRPRVYATQSVHKTLAALRQASVILEADHYRGLNCKYSGIDSPRFQQSYLAATTTSPSMPIIASFDIARRQMNLEGATQISNAVKSAARFKKNLNEKNWASLGKSYSLLPDSNTRISKQNHFPKDPTKVTVFHRLPYSSSLAKKQLWKHGQIQVNKFGVDNLMFMFMPGYKSTRVRNLLSQMKKVADEAAKTTKLTKQPLAFKAPSLERCVDQDGAIKNYPVEVANSGRWGMAEFLFGNKSSSAKPFTSKQIKSRTNYILCCFVTPYPPGFPILYPGQVVMGKKIKELLATDDEVHGINELGQIYLIEMP